MTPFLPRFFPRAAAEGRPALLGILNATPDSFSDGGLHAAPEDAVARAARLLADGADGLDVGAESTRPGFTPVPPDEELRRLLPVLRALRAAFPAAVLSVDTRHAAVARAALDLGASIVNDVSALADPDMAPLVASSGAGLVLMHGWPEHAGLRPRAAAPGALADWVASGLSSLLARALAAGIAPERICADPGFGFGLKRADNAEVLRGLPRIVAACAPCPLLVGPSRKHFLAEQFPEAAGDPDRATALFCAEAVRLGASALRVHDVAVVCSALPR